jgi:hypothetical protein
VLGETIEQRRRQLLVAAEHTRPLGKREIGGDKHAAPTVPRREHVEQQLAAGAIKRDEPNLVQDDQVDTLQASHRATELLLVARLHERAHQIGGAPKDNAPSLARRLDAERDRQMRLARADGACEEDVSPCAIHSPRASSAIFGAFTPSTAVKSKSSSVFISGNPAARRRCLTADSAREAISTASASCR